MSILTYLLKHFSASASMAFNVVEGRKEGIDR